MSFSFCFLFPLIHAIILRTPLCMFEQKFFTSFFCASPYFRGLYSPKYWNSSNVLIYFFVWIFHANTLRTLLCVFEQLFFGPISTLVDSISLYNEFHHVWFSYLYCSHPCDHFAHPTLYVCAKIFTSFFCASLNFIASHRSQYWNSSSVLIWFFVRPIET